MAKQAFWAAPAVLAVGGAPQVAASNVFTIELDSDIAYYDGAFDPVSVKVTASNGSSTEGVLVYFSLSGGTFDNGETNLVATIQDGFASTYTIIPNPGVGSVVLIVQSGGAQATFTLVATEPTMMTSRIGIPAGPAQNRDLGGGITATIIASQGDAGKWYLVANLANAVSPVTTLRVKSRFGNVVVRLSVAEQRTMILRTGRRNLPAVQIVLSRVNIQKTVIVGPS